MTRIIFLIFLCLSAKVSGQISEFNSSKNGLIYSDTTIKQLKFIVDSLNLKFKVCDLNRDYLSIPQAKGHYISLDSANVDEAHADLMANVSFDDFIVKYPHATIDKELLIIKFNYKNYENKDRISFECAGVSSCDHDLIFDENLERYQDENVKGKWIIHYHPKTDYSTSWVEAFYFTNNFTQIELPVSYARMIQYSDCMIDTSSSIFHEDAFDVFRTSKKNAAEENKVLDFLNFVNKFLEKPVFKGKYSAKKYDKFEQEYSKWLVLKDQKTDSLKAHDSTFTLLLNAAVLQAISEGGSDDEFEEYVARYYSPKTALELKRKRRVVGNCSRDNRPREHALNIAKLSAESVSWEIFLRAHLDIMNDNFERVSDGSYAWQGRKTYIKELEILDINVLDLLLGISLRIKNASTNHYIGSIGRIGRALAESAYSDELERRLLNAISDSELDDFNRLIFYYLFKNYNYNLADQNKQLINNQKLQLAVKTLPDYLVKKADLQNNEE